MQLGDTEVCFNFKSLHYQTRLAVSMMKQFAEELDRLIVQFISFLGNLMETFVFVFVEIFRMMAHIFAYYLHCSQTAATYGRSKMRGLTGRMKDVF